MIPFNKPFLVGSETKYIEESVLSGKISGDGVFTNKVVQFLDNKYKFKNVLLTTSCTDALEMASILLDVKIGDEIIVPSYTFVSTANPFVLRGATIRFADSLPNHPNIDPERIEQLINENTKAIIVVHYAGVACEMDKIMAIANKYDLMVVEDAAQAISSLYYSNEINEWLPLGSIGTLSAFSFHETKNIISGEGGMLVVNNQKLYERAEIIREKGTDRSKFFRGEIDKYGWVDIGSSFLPSDIIAAFLFAQLENVDLIHRKRIELWNRYATNLNKLEKNGVQLPFVPSYSTNNAHIFYLVCRSETERNDLIDFLRKKDVYAVFHYQSLHKSTFIQNTQKERPELPNADRYSSCLVRLPLYYELTIAEVNYISDQILNFYASYEMD